MSLYPWVLTEKRKKLREIVQQTPEGHKDFANVLEMALEEWIKTHSKTNNPQTTLGQYEDPTYKAVPAISLNYEPWKKYYKDLTKKELKEMDEKLKLVLYYHEKRRKELEKNDR